MEDFKDRSVLVNITFFMMKICPVQDRNAQSLRYAKFERNWSESMSFPFFGIPGNLYIVTN